MSRCETHGTFLFAAGITGYPDMLTLAFGHAELAVDLIGVVSRGRLDLPVVSLHGSITPCLVEFRVMVLIAGEVYRGRLIRGGVM